jgi:hypothetical protein
LLIKIYLNLIKLTLPRYGLQTPLGGMTFKSDECPEYPSMSKGSEAVAKLHD